MQKTPIYPIDDVLPQLLEAFQRSTKVVLSAPTGAGKTTRVPIALLASEWMSGKKLIMLEPRRLAARRAAEYMAAQLGESVGKTIGYRIRGETIVSKNDTHRSSDRRNSNPASSARSGNARMLH